MLPAASPQLSHSLTLSLCLSRAGDRRQPDSFLRRLAPRRGLPLRRGHAAAGGGGRTGGGHSTKQLGERRAREQPVQVELRYVGIG
jgi:hypothetical protein